MGTIVEAWHAGCQRKKPWPQCWPPGISHLSRTRVTRLRGAVGAWSAAPSPTLTNVNGGRRCRACARYGFGPTAPAMIYLVVSKAHHAIKVGIMGTGSDRLDAHAALTALRMMSGLATVR
jgi:hypothetical protein